MQILIFWREGNRTASEPASEVIAGGGSVSSRGRRDSYWMSRTHQNRAELQPFAHRSHLGLHVIRGILMAEAIGPGEPK